MNEKKSATTCLTAIFVALTMPFSAAGVEFIEQPSAISSGSGLVISFSVSTSTDVEVAILNSENKIVCHLAAGVLGGEYAPPAPLAAGLSQSIIWDGNDDLGQPAVGAPFTARVRLGMQTAYQYSIDISPHPAQIYTGSPVPVGDIMDSANPLTVKYYTNDHGPPKLDIAVNDVNEQIYVKLLSDQSSGVTSLSATQYRYDGVTGTYLGATPFTGMSDRSYWGEIAFNWSGTNVYYMTAAGVAPIFRFTLLGADVTKIKEGLSQGWQHTRGMAPAPNGNIYVLHNIAHRSSTEGLVTKIDASGNIIDSPLIKIESPSSGIRVDAKGNIYVGALVKPYGQKLPSYLSGVVTQADYMGNLGVRIYGSVLKFGPNGGTILEDSTTAGDLAVGKKLWRAKAEGLEWMYYGLSPITSHGTWGYEAGAGCVCFNARFDVDRYGRIFLPDVFRYSVIILDNNRNPIMRYSYKDLPGTAKAWVAPHHVEATDRAFYVADYFTSQVASIQLRAEKEVTVALPPGSASENLAVTVTAGRFFPGNTPNPFHARTRILYQIPKPAHDQAEQRSQILIYDASCRLVRKLTVQAQGPGRHSIDWDGRDHSGKSSGNGIYICRFKQGSHEEEWKMLKVR